MARTLLAVMVLTLAGLPVFGQTTCSGFNGSLTLSLTATGDGTQHVAGGGHSAGFTPVGTCTYTHGTSANCNTSVSVTHLGETAATPLGGIVLSENGALTVPGVHVVNGAWQDGTCGAVGGGCTATAAVGGAATNCATSTNCAVSLSVSLTGVTITGSTGTVIWKSTPVGVPFTCASEADPQNSTAGIGTCDPCLCGSGGTGSGFTSGGGTNDAPDCSPVIIDVTGDGIKLTPSQFGIPFDMKGTGIKSIVAWTQPGLGAQGWLALDRNGNGKIDDGTELFGNFTPQPPSATPNGFAALAQFDKLENGGNNDNVIDAEDAVWPKLLVWVDYNHDGISQPEELKPLSYYHIAGIDLNYSQAARKDKWGNAFRYRANVIPDNSGQGKIGREAWDVFLTVTLNPANQK